MNVQDFQADFAPYLHHIQSAIATESGDWIVKGFIDVFRTIYTISVDTKVISKIMELMLLPVIGAFAEEHGYRLELSDHQNHYPDLTLTAPDETRIALDLKSTYRLNATRANGFTLGAFTGYFRDRQSTKNVTYPYASYSAHLILGIIYSRCDNALDEQRTYTIDDLPHIASVIGDFEVLLQEKWRLASDRPGSGNTKNIGSATTSTDLLTGNGVFAPHGPDVFDQYWMNYQTQDMAEKIGSVRPYATLPEYWAWVEKLRGDTIP